MTLFRYASQAIRILQSNNVNGNELSPDVRILCKQLEEGKLECFELGWQEQEFRYSCKEIGAICQSLQGENNYSTLEHVSVGWRLEKSALHERLLPAVAALPNLKKLKLSVHSYLHESMLCQVTRNSSLEELEIHGARMRTRAGVILDGNDRFRVEDYAYEDVNIVEMLRHVSHSRTIGKSNLKRLKLVNCGIRDEHIKYILCQLPLGLEVLCLKGNPGITSKGLEGLLAKDDCRTLELSECGIDSLDGLARLLDLPDCKVQDLKLGRNYRISKSQSFSEFFSVASRRLQKLDLSFCKLSGQHLAEIFEILQHPDCVLRSLILEGCRNIPGPSLCRMLSKNQSLQTLIFHGRQRTKKPSLPLPCYFEMIATLETTNYSLGRLETGDELPYVLQQLLLLNRAGRSIIRDGSGDWATALAKASTSTDALYWLVRNGANQSNQWRGIS